MHTYYRRSRRRRARLDLLRLRHRRRQGIHRPLLLLTRRRLPAGVCRLLETKSDARRARAPIPVASGLVRARRRPAQQRGRPNRRGRSRGRRAAPRPRDARGRGGAARRIAHAVPSMPCPCCARHAVDGTMHAVPCRAQGRGREKGRSGKLAARLDCALVRTSVVVRICSSPLRGYAAAHSHSAECRAPSAAEGSAPVSRGRTYRKIGRGHQCSASRKGSTDLDMRP